MHQKPLLSVIVTFHNQRSAIEPTLSALYEMESIPFELFIMEDGSTDGSNNAVQSLLDYYQHEQTYYFDHSERVGRANCLNEALQQCNSPVLWVPESINNLDEGLLKESVQTLQDSKFAFFNEEPLPASTNEWMDFLRQHRWPRDGSFLWNLRQIPPTLRFFSPFLADHHALELALRLTQSSDSKTIKPWYTPAAMGSTEETGAAAKTELALSLLRSYDMTPGQHSAMVDFLTKEKKSRPKQTSATGTDKLLAEARQMKQDGRFSSALELVENILSDQPNHQQAKQLKIEILERKRRFVEASELKHELSSADQSQHQEPPAGKIKTSIIIPTTLYGKPALEHCLVSLSAHCNPESTELIIIDNASLDDTHDYLEELRDKRFFNCRIITNKQNAGFAASVNQGLEKAAGQYACILHNDVELTNNALQRLEQLMDAHPEFAVAGPLTNKTLNPDQSVEMYENRADGLQKAEYLDSFCMMVRMDAGLRMDEEYQLAFFEDIDLCFQARNQGHKVGIAPGVEVEHHFGTTTFALNLDTESDEYWKNVSYFNDKWDVEVYSEDELKSMSRFDQLLALDKMVNPLYPEDKILDWFNRLFTDEVKTEILKTDHDPATLCQLVHLMMVMDQRDVMRRLEDQLDDIELPATLVYQLIRFYFNRNIYSRCTHYLNRLKAEQQSLQSELYKLEILVNEKELEAAIPKLKELLDQAPAHPALYKLAGDIHRFEGNEEEAESFYQVAHQINPFAFSPEGTEEFRLKS